MPHWGVIRARGADAAQFIHGQLSQDFVLLGPDQARLAAFCNAKGRMQASFIGIKPDAQTILLVCERSLLAQTLKRLRMFVLRAQCQLDDASEAFALWGLVGASVPAPCALARRRWMASNSSFSCARNASPRAIVHCRSSFIFFLNSPCKR